MDCDFSPSSPHLLPNGLFSPQNRISFELLALSGLSGFSTFEGGKMLIFQWFANSRIVREFPPFSFKVRIATLTRNNGAYSTSRVRMGALTPWLRLYPNRPIMSSRCKKIFQILQKAHENRWLSLLKIETMRLRCFDRLCYFRTKNDFTAKSYTGVIHRLRHNCCFRSSLR